MSRGATEDKIDQFGHYEHSDLDERLKKALRLADRIQTAGMAVDGDFYAELRDEFSEDEILDLGMTIAFFDGWQRFIEAFDIRPDAKQDV